MKEFSQEEKKNNDSLIESLQAENEKLREQNSKLKEFAIMRKRILNLLYDRINHPAFSWGYIIGVIVASMIASFYRRD